MIRTTANGLRLVTLLLLAATAAGCSFSAEQRDASTDSAPPEQPAITPRPGTSIVIGSAPRASGGFASVVIIETDGGDDLPVPTEPVIMDQVGMEFAPGLLLARLGQPVEFRNSDDVVHNVRLVDLDRNSTGFNIVTPMGGSYVFTPEHSGTFGVECDIHPAMGAFLIITSSPHAVIADEDGTFVLAEVPYGSYTLRVWNVDRTRRSLQPLEIEGPQTLVSLTGDR